MAVLEPQSVLVTGTNQGIGLELVRQLIEIKNRPEWIFATCLYPKGPYAQELENLAAKHHGVVIIPLDVSDPSSIKSAAAQVSEHLKGAGLNLLINNAGIVKASTLETETLENMCEVYKVNPIGPMLVSQAFLPLLRKAAQGNPQKGMNCSKAAIVNISSQAGSMQSGFVWDPKGVTSYRCSKCYGRIPSRAPTKEDQEKILQQGSCLLRNIPVLTDRVTVLSQVSDPKQTFWTLFIHFCKHV